MPDIEKFMTVSADDIEKIMGVDSGDIETVMGVDMPAAGPAYTGQTFVCFGGNTSESWVIVDIDYKSSTSDGNASPFGEMSEQMNTGSAAGSQGARAVHAGGAKDPNYTTGRSEMEYITIASTGDTEEAGDLTVARGEGPGAAGNGTRAIWAGGYNFGGTYGDVMDYMAISSTGGATDFGDLNNDTGNGNCGGSLTRFLHSGGNSLVQQIDYVAFDTTGGASDFGDLQLPTRSNGGGISSEAVICNSQGGTELTTADPYSETSRTDRMDWVNPASTGSTDDFGDLIAGKRYVSGGFSDNTRGEIWGGDTRTDAIQYVDIAGKGDATEAGNMTVTSRKRSYSGASG